MDTIRVTQNDRGEYVGTVMLNGLETSARMILDQGTVNALREGLKPTPRDDLDADQNQRGAALQHALDLLGVGTSVEDLCDVAEYVTSGLHPLARYTLQEEQSPAEQADQAVRGLEGVMPPSMAAEYVRGIREPEDPFTIRARYAYLTVLPDGFTRMEFRGDPDETGTNASLYASRATVEVLTEHLPPHLGGCLCDTNPETTGGPEEDCPQHGRPYSYWVEATNEHYQAERRLGEQRAALVTHLQTRQNDMTEALGLSHSKRTGIALQERLAEVEAILEMVHPTVGDTTPEVTPTDDDPFAEF